METQDEIVMMPLSEILSIRWTEERRKRLKELRKEYPLTLSELNRRLSQQGVTVSRQYLSRMELDPEVKGISPELAKGLCGVLEVPLPELLCLNSQKIVQIM
ncbi:helix-turn-helix transcriptional regulator [Kamptonema sp. UHCC 0994]|uniref:helix-turn-helix domain-containing protein n=1 Tax=Kamptonema sp. UHCC 0994 TaxID=3031329 RepID=UPI0023B91174|nr:helix-turn-helix transcriptional regulator [Kamptonema sp. UHCC 0994]MDF0552206.1 helix-turn-helix transcriptional regulator [Kamptonema sp. UHCC 0994]